MNVFVTGASGFIGGHVARTLASGTHTVRALVRSDAAAAKVTALGAIPVRGDLGSVSPEEIGNAEVIVHAAAFVEEYGTPEQFWAVNVVGTQRVLAAARDAGARRFIHIGTEAAFFTGEDLVDIDERLPYPDFQRFPYSETKAEAEKKVLAAAAPGFHTLSIRPRLVWGPGDATILPTLLKRVEEGRWAWIDDGQVRTSTTHVFNLVRGVECALTKGVSGSAYYVKDDGEVILKDFLTALAATKGVTLPSKNVPRWLARNGAALAEGVWRTFSLAGAPPLVAFTASMMSSSVTVKADKARAELGWAPVITREEGLKALGEIPAS